MVLGIRLALNLTLTSYATVIVASKMILIWRYQNNFEITMGSTLSNVKMVVFIHVECVSVHQNGPGLCVNVNRIQLRTLNLVTIRMIHTKFVLDVVSVTVMALVNVFSKRVELSMEHIANMIQISVPKMTRDSSVVVMGLVQRSVFDPDFFIKNSKNFFRITRVNAILDGLVKRVTVKTVPTSVPLMMVFVMVMASANVINVNVILLILVSLLNQTSVKLSNLVASNMHHVHNVHTMDF